MIREPIVSGRFYPHKKEEIERLLADFAPINQARINARGIVLPHAGYMYSGRVAAVTAAKIMPKKTLVIIGNNHGGRGCPFAVWKNGGWKTPYGTIAINEDLAARMTNASGPIKEDYAAHAFEHSIEVQLPILRHYLGEFDFVPISVQESSMASYENAAAQIYRAIRIVQKDILLVASTDMTHYEPETAARRKDKLAIEAIVNIDPENLIRTVKKNDISMCGAGAVAVMLFCLKQLNARKAQIALYETSARAGGDMSSVVGYAGIIIQ